MRLVSSRLVSSLISSLRLTEGIEGHLIIHAPDHAPQRSRVQGGGEVGLSNQTKGQRKVDEGGEKGGVTVHHINGVAGRSWSDVGNVVKSVGRPYL